jgi:hypothetical protein
MKNLFKIELDICLEEGEELKAIAEMLNTYEVSISHIDPEGPGGGHPCITFIGTEENILKLGMEITGEDEECINDWMESNN